MSETQQTSEKATERTRSSSWASLPLGALTSMMSTATSTVNAVSTGVTTSVGKVTSGVSSGVTKVTSGVTSGVTKVTSGISPHVDKVTGAVSSGVGAVSSGVSTQVGKMTGAVSSGVGAGIGLVSNQAKAVGQGINSAVSSATNTIIGTTGKSSQASLETATDLMMACVRRTEEQMREDGMKGSVECEICVGFPLGCRFTTSVSVDGTPCEEKKKDVPVDSKEWKSITAVINSAITGTAIHACRLQENGAAGDSDVQCAVSGSIIWASIEVSISSTVDDILQSTTGQRKAAEKAAAKAEATEATKAPEEEEKEEAAPEAANAE